MSERDHSLPIEEISSFSSAENNLTPEKGNFLTLSAPVTCQWELTNSCSFGCKHCYNYWRSEDKTATTKIDEDYLRTQKRAAEQIVRNNIFSVTLTGGEPLLVLEDIYPSLEILAKNEVAMSLNSNLALLDKKKVQMLKSLKIRSILTSLMSADEKTNNSLANKSNAFRLTVEGIKTALDEGFWVAVNMVVSQENLEDIYQTAEFVKSLGATAFSATKASKPVNCKDFRELALSVPNFRLMMQELLRVRENLGLDVDSLEAYPMCVYDTQSSRDLMGNRICNAGKSSCTIGVDGQIRPCSHTTQQYGSIHKENGLREAWLKLQPWRTMEFVPNECGDCRHIYWCRGGCRSEAYAYSGDLKAPDPYCDLTRPALEKSPPEKIEVNPQGIFEFHKSLRTRDEEFGGIIYLTPVRWAAVTKTLLGFYEQKSENTFTLVELAGALDVNATSVVATAEHLIRKSIVSERR